jgi:glycosyltransferase involved in cell wall biosynthesis
MRSLIRFLYPRATSIIAVSEAAAEQLRELVPGAGKNIRSVVNPVLTEDLIEGGKQSPTHKWFTDDYQVVMGLGRLTAQKDFETLIRAFAQAEKPEQARLVIFGEGEDRIQLKDLVLDLGLHDLVDLPGYTNEPYAHLSNASLFVLSSAWEGLPTVLIEALALACPVVSTDCPTGPSEILQNGRYGALVPVGDVDILSREMSAFFSGDRYAVPDSDSLKQYTPAVVAEVYWQFMTR